MPQLLAPLNLMFCAASLCQDNSSESFPIMRDEVGEHMARDLRPFNTYFLWGFGRGTVMAMAKPLFCSR